MRPLACLCLLALFAFAAPSPATCPPEGHDRASLDALREQGFTLADDGVRNALALALVDCLHAPDPELRDSIAFEALSAWLRGGQIARETRTDLLVTLLAKLEASDGDAAGFRRPFAALALSEVVRTDRIEPWLSNAQRETLVAAATRYLESVTDHRGFDDREGWRHGVAHGADLLLQLALNPALDADQIERILAAVRQQIAPPDHFYVFGEPERLARPVLYAALRETRSADQWREWFAGVASPAPLPDWQAAFRSRSGLARRHNVRAFLSALYVQSRDSEDPRLAALAPTVLSALRSIP